MCVCLSFSHFVVCVVRRAVSHSRSSFRPAKLLKMLVSLVHQTHLTVVPSTIFRTPSRILYVYVFYRHAFVRLYMYCYNCMCIYLLYLFMY